MSKTKKKRNKTRSNSVIKTAEKTLKAIVFADSFSKEFRPITLELPRVLLPLNNIPIIDYVLELLICSSVKEIYIYCHENEEKISEYIHKSKWKKRSIEDEIIIETRFVKNATSVIDFLRDLTTSNIGVTDDFLILPGDVISSIDLKPIIEFHQRERKRKGSLLLMTSVFVKDEIFYATGCGKNRGKILENNTNDNVCIAIGKGKEYYYPELLNYKNYKNEKLFIQSSKFDIFDEIEIVSNVFDSNIDICSPEVLKIVQENFDYVSMRNDLLKNALTDEVISSTNKICPYIVEKSSVSQRVNSIHAYEMISNKITKSWLYPITPDSNFTGLTEYRKCFNRNYLEPELNLDSNVISDSIIGQGTSIGENSAVKSCVLGRNVKIGQNCLIVESYIWDNAVIEDDVQINKSLIMKAVIKKGARLKFGNVITSDVIIGEGFSVEEHARITTRKDDNTKHESFNKIEFAKTIESEVGKGGVGRKYKGFTSDRKFNIFGYNNLTDEEYVEGEEEEGEEDIVKKNLGDETETFKSEIKEIVYKAIEKDYPIEDFLFDVNSRKFANDYSMVDTGKAIIIAIIQYSEDGEGVKRIPAEKVKKMNEIFQNILKKKIVWSSLLQNYLKDEKDWELHLLDSILDFCLNEGKSFAPIFQNIINELHEARFFKEDSIIKWYDEINQSDNEEDKTMLVKCKDLIEWIKEGKENEEDDDEEEEDEEKEDEEEEEDEEEDEEDEDEEEDEEEEEEEEDDQ